MLRYTDAALRQHENDVLAMMRLVRSTFSPEETAIVTVNGQDPFRFAMYYLPEYRVLLVGDPGGPLLMAHERLTEYSATTACLPGAVRSILWITDTASRAALMPASAVPVETGARELNAWHLWTVPITAARESCLSLASELGSPS